MTEQKQNKELYVNRELSWLLFNTRVLEESEDRTIPLFERLKFVSIFTSNLDEFFMVRVGSLYDQCLLKEVVVDSKTGMTAKEQLDKIYAAVKDLLPRKDASYAAVMKELESQGVCQLDMNKISSEEEKYLDGYFRHSVLPLLSPQIIDKTHPFPFLENKKLYVGVRLHTKSGDMKLGIVPADRGVERMVFLKKEEGIRFVLMEDLILHFINQIFDEHKIMEKTIFRITRNADIDVEDNMIDTDLDYRKAMEELLKKRRKLAPVRLEVHSPIGSEMEGYLCEKLGLKKAQVFVDRAPLDMSFVFPLGDRLTQKTQLFDKPLKPQKHPGLRDDLTMTEQIRKKDFLLQYPYQEFKPIVRLLEESAQDPDVLSIKMTLYRVASNSQVVNALIKAAENGKEVSVVVELKARFDEANNIDWSKRMEEAGCNVVYGLDGYKVHSKLMLILRKTKDGVEYISHVGTGNFNEKTAKLYTDLALLTANKDIGVEVSTAFNCLFMGQTVDETQHLLVAPCSFKNKVIQMIDREIAVAKGGDKAEIILKINSLTDKVLINKLVEASKNGVKVSMIVRGICCLRAGIPGETENIRVISIVGRFLEHSRIYVFGCGERRKVYIASADFMTRNTERRVEVAAPIYQKDIEKELLDILSTMFKDNVKARKMQPDGSYVRQTNDQPALDSQIYFYKKAYKEAEEAAKKAAEMPKPRPQMASPSVLDRLRSLLQKKK